MKSKLSVFRSLQSTFTKRIVFVSAFLLYVTAFYFTMVAGTAAQSEEMGATGASLVEETRHPGDGELDDAVSEICDTLVRQGHL